MVAQNWDNIRIGAITGHCILKKTRYIITISFLQDQNPDVRMSLWSRNGYRLYRVPETKILRKILHKSRRDPCVGNLLGFSGFLEVKLDLFSMLDLD